MKSTPGSRPRRERDAADYLRFVRRAIQAAGQRVADGDVEAFADLVNLRMGVYFACNAAVAGLRASGVTWEQIGAVTGVTRQAALMRWSPAVAAFEACKDAAATTQVAR